MGAQGPQPRGSSPAPTSKSWQRQCQSYCAPLPLLILLTLAGAACWFLLAYAQAPPLPASLHAHSRAPPQLPVSAAALLAACHARRGRGPAHYAALPQARHVTLAALEARELLHEEDRVCGGEVRRNGTAAVEVVHCCELRVVFNGLAGNILTQYAAARFFAELNSCAVPYLLFASRNSPHNEMGAQPGLQDFDLQWPLAAGARLSGANGLHHLIDAYAYFRAPAQTDTTLDFYPEHSSLLYTALSFGWDLAGGSLMWSGVRGLNKEVISGNSTAERGQRWAAHREACAQAGMLLLAKAQEEVAATETPAKALAKQPPPPLLPPQSLALELAVDTVLEGLHPWLASQLEEEVQLLLRRTHARMTPQLRAFLAHPERTIVLHMRLGDQYRKALHDAQQRGAGIQRGTRTDALDWLGERLFPSDTEVNVPQQTHLDMLEGNAARVDLVMPPLSYYTTVLRATVRAWDSVLVVGDASLASNPVFRALQAEFNASLQSGSPALDMATLLLARQLVVSGGSTFSFTAAAQGRARVIHAPHAALMSLRTWTGTCFVTPSRFDARWVFHDVFRAGVRRVARGFAAQAAAARAEGLAADAVVTRAWALNASAGEWKEHVEFRRQPLAYTPPQWDEGCPGDAPGVGARGLARALGLPEPAGEPGPAQAATVPLYFLTFEELVGYYRRPACSDYFFPGFTQDFHNNNGRLTEGGLWGVCADDAPLAPLNQDIRSRGCRMWGQHPAPCDE